MGRFPGFVGASYTSQSVNVECQRCVNWYPELVESGAGKNRYALYPTPGLKLFAALGGNIRGQWEINGRAFAVAGSTLYELFANGTFVARGEVGNDGAAVSLASNPQQLLICSAGHVYVLTLADSTLTTADEVTTESLPAVFTMTPALHENLSPGGLKAEWQNTDNTVSTTDFCTAGPTNLGTDYLHVGTFTPPIDDGVEITGIEIRFNAKAWAGPESVRPLEGRSITAYLNKANAAVGELRAHLATWQVEEAVLGGPDDLWGTTWTAAEINAAGFGAWIDATLTGTDVYSAGINNVRIIVYVLPRDREVRTPLTSIAKVAYSDSYFIALAKDAQSFTISSLLDGKNWDPADKGIVSVFPDNVLTMIVDHREIALFGRKQSITYYNSGNPDFPFEPVLGSLMEQGIDAAESVIKADNTYFWLGADERGHAIAWRAQGYTPVRVSNHAVEHTWQGYATCSDAKGYSYQEDGHTFWVLTFPSANATWVFDIATGLWHERGTWANGKYVAQKGQYHVFAFGKHLVGDGANLYELAIGFNDENGSAIRRMRRAPHVSNELEWMYFNALQLDLEPGLANVDDGAGGLRAPQVMVRWSDDAGHTWSNEHWLSAGRLGEYRTRMILRRLGRSRDRVFEVVVTDPVPWRIVDAYLK